MKIDFVLVSTNENQLYFDFWDVIKPIWIDVINIKPILVVLDNYNEIFDAGDHIIHKIKKISGVDTAFQSQIARMFATKYYRDFVCLTSDIDMIPLSKKYFNETVKEYDENSLVILSSDAYKDVNRYPICYNVAKGETFIDVLNIDCTFEEYCKRLISYNWGWSTDELYFGKCVNEFSDQKKIVKINRGWESGGIASKRIDRINWNYNQNKINSDYYIDCHSLRPYKTYKDEINKLLKLVLK